jgi:protoheme IX farnesyltransferase
MSGWIYLLGALGLGLGFLYWALVLVVSDNPRAPMETFRYSILYLALLFIALLVDHYFVGPTAGVLPMLDLQAH